MAYHAKLPLKPDLTSNQSVSELEGNHVRLDPKSVI